MGIGRLLVRHYALAVATQSGPLLRSQLANRRLPRKFAPFFRVLPLFYRVSVVGGGQERAAGHMQGIERARAASGGFV